MERKIKWKDLKNETKKYIHGFQQFEAIRSFGDNIRNGKITIDESGGGSGQSIRKFSRI